MVMVEAAEYDAMDRTFPLFGVISDMLCGDWTNAAGITSFTRYMDLVNIMLRQNGAQLWNEKELTSMNNMVVSFI